MKRLNFFVILMTIAAFIVNSMFSFLIFGYSRPLGLIAMIISIIVLISFYFAWNHKFLSFQMDIEELSFDMQNASKDILLTFPFPIARFNYNDPDSEISWKNSEFTTSFPEVTKMLDLITKEQIEELINKRGYLKVSHNNHSYLAFLTKINDTSSFNYVVYFIDKSDYYSLLEKYQDEKKIVALIFIDNYYEISEAINSEQDIELLTIVDKKINAWASKTSGIIKKYDRDKYVFIFNKSDLEKFKHERFTILEYIRNIHTGTDIPITLSIGIGEGGKSLAENSILSRSAIELALGRGGDQVVVKNLDKTYFYGGKTKEVEKRSKVRARVIAHAMSEIIRQSDNVIIMGHKMPDMDCLGAAIGISRGVRSQNKQVNIVLNSTNNSIQRLIDKIKNCDEFDNIFITSEEALQIVSEDTLIIVVDTHRPESVECPELLQMDERVVLIDHHRRGNHFIENAIITYLEPYASSASELVTELVQYMGNAENEAKLTINEAEALLAGIIVDTKNFCFKTGVRTFEAASFLRKQGANSTVVRQLFQNDIGIFLERYNIVKNAQIFNEDIAISTYENDNKDISLAVAQAADELLTIQGIKASFVLCKNSDEIIISGRSYGDINVQTILERLGGGGHFTIAGAQLKDISMEDAIEKLKQAILAD